MGSLYKGVCYPDLQSAQREVCSAQSQTWGVTDTVFSATCSVEQSDENRIVVYLKKNGETYNYFKQEYPVFAECDHTGGSGLAYEWFLVAMGLLVVVWGGKQLLRLFENHQDKD